MLCIIGFWNQIKLRRIGNIVFPSSFTCLVSSLVESYFKTFIFNFKIVLINCWHYAFGRWRTRVLRFWVTRRQQRRFTRQIVDTRVSKREKTFFFNPQQSVLVRDKIISGFSQPSYLFLQLSLPFNICQLLKVGHDFFSKRATIFCGQHTSSIRLKMIVKSSRFENDSLSWPIFLNSRRLHKSALIFVTENSKAFCSRDDWNRYSLGRFSLKRSNSQPLLILNWNE